MGKVEEPSFEPVLQNSFKVHIVHDGVEIVPCELVLSLEHDHTDSYDLLCVRIYQPIDDNYLPEMIKAFSTEENVDIVVDLLDRYQKPVMKWSYKTQLRALELASFSYDSTSPAFNSFRFEVNEFIPEVVE